MSNTKPPKLHSHWEYEAACRVQRMMKNKKYLTGLSENEANEYKELNARIYAYRKATKKKQ